MREQPPGLTTLGKVVLVLLVGSGLLAGYYLIAKPDWSWLPGASKQAPAGGKAAPRAVDGDAVRVGIAYGTEKKAWLEWAAEQFAQAPDGEGIELDLQPLGSLEAAQKLLGGDTSIQVWSPASNLYTETFAVDWKLRQSREPFVRAEPLALTPMVFVMWKTRHDAFVKRYGEVSFRSVGQALAEPTGWAGIADKPEWGLFKFGHAEPNQSNSGLATLVLMAHDHAGKSRGLSLADILDQDLLKWLTGIEGAVSGLANSTGNMMREMVLKGPASFDLIFAYESVAIDFLPSAEGRWGELRIVYPRRNLWNDNPYYILDAPWSSPEQRRAAGAFLDFLLSERVQRQALVHGFRPANLAVAVRAPDSPFQRYARYGLEVELADAGEPPAAEVIQNLLQIWQRTQIRR
jgi:ABC-type Fe3+ transport system substrate-binding protein